MIKVDRLNCKAKQYYVVSSKSVGLNNDYYAIFLVTANWKHLGHTYIMIHKPFLNQEIFNLFSLIFLRLWRSG